MGSMRSSAVVVAAVVLAGAVGACELVAGFGDPREVNQLGPGGAGGAGTSSSSGSSSGVSTGAGAATSGSASSSSSAGSSSSSTSSGSASSSSSSTSSSSASSSSGCTGNFIACGDAGTCVDKETDINNCGACGYTCVNATPCCTAGACSALPTWYQDLDGDGYGNPNVARQVCAQPTGFVADKTDCCDADAKAHPGQTAWFTVVDGCGSFDYNCDGVDTQQINGPNDCLALTCAFNASNMCVATSALPSDCNGNAMNYTPAACGMPYYGGAAFCQSGGTASCYVMDVGTGVLGTQACH